MYVYKNELLSGACTELLELSPLSMSLVCGALKGKHTGAPVSTETTLPARKKKERKKKRPNSCCCVISSQAQLAHIQMSKSTSCFDRLANKRNYLKFQVTSFIYRLTIKLNEGQVARKGIVSPQKCLS